MSKMIVRNSNGSWAHYSINKTISTVREGVMINPYVAWAKDRNGITISHCPPAEMGGWTPHHGISSWFAVMDVESMDNNIGNKLDRETSSIGNVNIVATCINCLETVHNELLFQLYYHVAAEHNPQGLLLDNSMTNSTRPGVNRVIVTIISDHIVTAITTTNGIAPKSNATISEAFAVLLPVGVTSPAVINRISCSTWEISKFSPLSAVPNAPV